MAMVGVGYRQPLAGWIDSQPSGLECLEITAEHFFDGGHERLRQLRGRFALFVHGLGLSLGTPGPLDAERLDRFARVVEAAQPEWISEHVAFTRTPETDLGHLNPIRPTRESARLIADHARAVADRCQRPIILENITSHLRINGELSEPEFLNAVCEAADCGLLLDVTNLFISSRNHGFDALEWLRALDPARIVQLHIVGFAQRGERYADDHAHPVQPELLDLAREVIAYAPVRAIILERDVDFPAAETMADELDKLRRLFVA
jgi:uncharacterized protein (UPF0276 family)